MNAKTGAFTATAPTASNHGPIEAFNTFYLRYADSTPYHPFGTPCYAWVHQPRELQEQALKTLAAAPFNKIRFCVFPKSYAYNTTEPEFFAFKKGADGKFHFNQPDPAFWRHFEQRILDLQQLGIEADLILWHPYDRWGFADMSDAEDDRYLRYCIEERPAVKLHGTAKRSSNGLFHLPDGAPLGLGSSGRGCAGGSARPAFLHRAGMVETRKPPDRQRREPHRALPQTRPLGH